MKKIALLAISVVTTFAATAQSAVVKEAERAMKGGKEAKEVVSIITPALTNTETANLAQTWYIPGKASMNQYDNLSGLKALGKLPAGAEVLMANLILDAYKYYDKVLPLDSLPDAKGKVKPKYSKEIYGTLAGHINDYIESGITFFDANDYENAYRSFEVYNKLPDYPEIRKLLEQNGTMPTDSMRSVISYNQGIAAYQAKNLENALNSFLTAKKLDPSEKKPYDFAIQVATELDKQDVILELAEEAHPRFGEGEPAYMKMIVNYYLQNGDLDKAFEIINQAIEIDPNVPDYYIVLGVLYENADNRLAAKDAYKKVVDLDPNHAIGVYYYGRQVYEDACALIDNSPTRQEEFNEYYATKIKPVLEESAQILENAYSLDPDNTDILKYLENVYYSLNDEKMLDDVKKRLEY